MEKIIPEHRIQCSFRLLIGPLDDDSLSPFRAEPSSSSQSNNATPHFAPLRDTDNTSSNCLNSRLSAVDRVNDRHNYHGHPSSSNDISNTALQHLHATSTNSSPTQYTTTNNNGSNAKQHDSFSSQFETTTDPAAASISYSSLKSASPADNITNSHHDTEDMADIFHENRRSQDNTAAVLDRSVLWRNSGPVFVPPLPKRYTNFNNNNTVIKHGVLLCNRLTYHCSGKQPSIYKQQHTHTHTTTPRKRNQEEWRQLEIILTPGALKCYASSGLVWPKRSIQHDISLDGPKDANLSLYLLSPLDYTFCIEYAPSVNETDTLTLVFRARSLTMCQEWYMAIYQLLPNHARKPTPDECKIYIPFINIHVHLPLINLQNDDDDDNNNNNNGDAKYLVTMEHVKEATMTLLENDSDWQSVLGNQWVDRNDLSLCWVRNERAEWIFWKNSVDGHSKVDMALCPQNIEKTHRLELRPTQHTPHTIILADETVLKEPHPCEGFLTKVTSFEGRHIKTANPWTPKRFYFATFDGFLFVIPAEKAVVPHTRTFVDPVTRPSMATNGGCHQQQLPFVTLVTPFANNSKLSCGWQKEELNRRMKLIANAVGCINLTEVTFVQRSSSSFLTSYNDAGNDTTQDNANGSYTTTSTDVLALPPPSSTATASLLTHDYDNSLSDRQHLGDKQQHGIDLVMENGIIIKLEAYSSETCDQWIAGLSDLVLYAKARLEADRDIHGDNVNNTSLAMDMGTEMGEKGDMDSITSRSSACHHGTSCTNHSSSVDTRIWSLCLFTQCRDIAKSGILYVQSKGVFSQKQFILTMDGRLHYFNIFKRSMDDGQPIQSGIHERKATLGMANAYIYSGMMSTFDNKSSKACVDRHARLFDNGIATDDSTEDCLFTIWIPQRRRVYSPRRQCIVTYDADRRFNSIGQPWLFMALSRQDKEAWMWAISIIQEQLLRAAIK